MVFDLVNFRQSPEVAIFAGEARGDEGTHYLKRKLDADHARAQAENIAVIMLARLMT